MLPRTRRGLLRGSMFLAIAGVLAACTSSGPAETSEPDRPSDRAVSITTSAPSFTTTSAATTTSAPPAIARPTPLRLSYDGAAPGLTNEGDAALNIRLVSGAGGTVTTEPGRAPEDGRAARFPAFGATAATPRAIFEVTNPDGTDRLNPGDGRFEFGSDVTIDATSADLDPASLDDGDNVVQRGRYDDNSQYKLEIDLRQPICRVKGRSGELTVVAGTQLEPDRWYRVQCIRDAGRLTVRVGTWAPDGSLSSREWSKTGPSGELAPADATVPLSIGGKLGANGPAGDADQFNGRLDNTYLSIG